MKWHLGFCLLFLASAPAAFAQYAVEVVSYDLGTNPEGAFLNPQAALGSPERFTGEGSFPGAVTMFNSPWMPDEIVSIGEGGHITLRLSHFVIPDPSGPEIGVFENVNLFDENWPNGQAGNPAQAFGFDDATVEVSADGLTWESLGLITFDMPTQGYSDVAGTIPSNFQQPFTGELSDFDDLALSDPDNPDILDLLAGSGGGKWIDISGTSLAKVGYIRFSVADTPANANFELDAVAISAAAMGGRVPEPSALVLVGIAVAWGIRRR